MNQTEIFQKNFRLVHMIRLMTSFSVQATEGIYRSDRRKNPGSRLKDKTFHQLATLYMATLCTTPSEQRQRHTKKRIILLARMYSVVLQTDRIRHCCSLQTTSIIISSRQMGGGLSTAWGNSYCNSRKEGQSHCSQMEDCGLGDS